MNRFWHFFRTIIIAIVICYFGGELEDKFGRIIYSFDIPYFTGGFVGAFLMYRELILTHTDESC